MKKYILSAGLVIALWSCNDANNTSKTADDTNQTPNATDSTQTPDGMTNSSPVSTNPDATRTDSTQR